MHNIVSDASDVEPLENDEDVTSPVLTIRLTAVGNGGRFDMRTLLLLKPEAVAAARSDESRSEISSERLISSASG